MEFQKKLKKLLALGTVQFGIDYGISNHEGQVSVNETKAILSNALAYGIDTLDTAPSYGTSEQTLGDLLSNEKSFKIVTKTPVLNDISDIDQYVAYFKSVFRRSLSNLRCSSVYGLLVHRVEDLMQHDGERLWAVMEDLKLQGYVSKIGFSVYDAEQIDKIVARFPIDIIQLPVNVFDQRLIKSGHLSMLKTMGVEIHARSAFLQGLLLMKPSDLTPFLKPVAGLLDRYCQAISAQNVTPVQAALSFVSNIPQIDKIVCGVTHCKQLKEICSIENGAANIDYSVFICDDVKIIDPSKWER